MIRGPFAEQDSILGLPFAIRASFHQRLISDPGVLVQYYSI